MSNALVLSDKQGHYQITDRGLAKIEQLSARGLPMGNIAKAMGIPRDAFVKLRKEDPRVQDAIDVGRGEVTEELTGLLLKQAREGSIAAIIFGLKTFGGFKEGSLIDGSVPTPPTTNNTQFNITIPPKMTADEFGDFVRSITTVPTPDPKQEDQT